MNFTTQPACLPDTWDQKIPNEAIEARPYIFQQPPIIPQVRPRPSSQCVYDQDGPYLYNKSTEKAAAAYWENVTAPSVKVATRGLPLAKEMSAQKFSKTLESNPDRPWLYGVTWNVDVDSHLRRLDYYNPKDCMRPCVDGELCRLNETSDRSFRQAMWASRVQEPRLWAQSTRPRNSSEEHAFQEKCQMAEDTWMR